MEAGVRDRRRTGLRDSGAAALRAGKPAMAFDPRKARGSGEDRRGNRKAGRSALGILTSAGKLDSPAGQGSHVMARNLGYHGAPTPKPLGTWIDSDDRPG